MIRYISKGDWFDKGIECTPIDGPSGINYCTFLGVRTCQDPSVEKYPLGDWYVSEKTCLISHFEIVEDKKDRTFFGKPMTDISFQYHPYKENAEKFVTSTKEALDSFLENMKSLDDHGNMKFTEQWMETFLAWYEINQDA